MRLEGRGGVGEYLHAVFAVRVDEAHLGAHLYPADQYSLILAQWRYLDARNSPAKHNTHEYIQCAARSCDVVATTSAAHRHTRITIIDTRSCRILMLHCGCTESVKVKPVFCKQVRCPTMQLLTNH